MRVGDGDGEGANPNPRIGEVENEREMIISAHSNKRYDMISYFRIVFSLFLGVFVFDELIFYL